MNDNGVFSAHRIVFPGVNACAICDCSNDTFRVGVQQDEHGNNNIRCLECERCGHKLPVPFFASGTG